MEQDMDDSHQRDSNSPRTMHMRHFAPLLAVILGIVFSLLGLFTGCRSRDLLKFDPDHASFQAYVQEIEYPEVCEMNPPDG